MFEHVHIHWSRSRPSLKYFLDYGSRNIYHTRIYCRTDRNMVLTGEGTYRREIRAQFVETI